MEITAQVLGSKAESQAELPLSVSKVKTFDDCKAKYRYSYIEKLPRKEWDFHVFGSFSHEVLEIFHKSLLKSSSEDHATVMTQAFKEACETFKGKITKTQKDDAWKMMNTYLQQSADEKPEFAPEILALEKSFFIDIGLDDQPHVLLNGFIDRIQKDPDGIIHVADYKTTKNKRYLKDFFQLLTYSFALMVEDPSIEKVRASFILLRHDFEYLTKEFTRDDAMATKQTFIDYANKIGKEKLWRPSPQFLCNYCDFLDVCDEGKQYLIRRNIKTPETAKSGFGKTTFGAR